MPELNAQVVQPPAMVVVIGHAPMRAALIVNHLVYMEVNDERYKD